MEDIIKYMNDKREADLRLKEYLDLNSYSTLIIWFVSDMSASFQEIDISKSHLFDDYENNYAYLYKTVMYHAHKHTDTMHLFTLSNIDLVDNEIRVFFDRN